MEVIRRAIEAFNSGDVERMLSLVDPAFEWRPAFGAAPDGGTAYQGHAGFREYWRGTQEIWDRFHFSAERFGDEGETVVVVGRGSGRAKGSGVEIDQPFAMLFRLRAGRPVFGQTFTDHDEALRAAGMSE